MDTEDKHVFFDKLTFMYIEMPKFNKTEDQLVTMLDKWLFVLRNLTRLMEKPAALQERIFTRLFEQAEIAKFNKEDRRDYEQSMKAYRDISNAIIGAKMLGRKEGIEEGRKEGRKESLIEIARKLKAKGMGQYDISEITGLSVDDMEGV